MNVRIMSREDIEKKKWYAFFSEKTAVVSFYSEHLGGQVDYSKCSAKVLHIPLEDIDYDDLACADDIAFYFTQAVEAAEFVHSAVKDGCDIVCQCEDGVGVSAGCAAAVLEFYEGCGMAVFANEKYFANKLVYRKIYDALSAIDECANPKKNTVEVEVASRTQIKKLIHSGKLTSDTAVISFYDVGIEPVYFGITQAAVCTLALDDLSKDEITQRYGSADFYFQKADTVARFIVDAVKKGRKIICQCEMGMSRSAACAAAILEYFCGSGISIFADKRYSPNRVVFQKLYSALCRDGVKSADLPENSNCSAQNKRKRLADLVATMINDLIRTAYDGAYDLHGGISGYVIVTSDRVIHYYDLWNPEVKYAILREFFEKYSADDIEYIMVSTWHTKFTPKTDFDVDSETGVLYIDDEDRNTIGSIEMHNYTRCIEKKFEVTEKEAFD